MRAYRECFRNQAILKVFKCIQRHPLDTSLRVRTQRTPVQVILEILLSPLILHASRCILCLRAPLVDRWPSDWHNLRGWLSLSPKLRILVLLLVGSYAGSRLLQKFRVSVLDVKIRALSQPKRSGRASYLLGCVGEVLRAVFGGAAWPGFDWGVGLRL